MIATGDGIEYMHAEDGLEIARRMRTMQTGGTRAGDQIEVSMSRSCFSAGVELISTRCDVLPCRDGCWR